MCRICTSQMWRHVKNPFKHPVVLPKSSCDVHILRSLWYNLPPSPDIGLTYLKITIIYAPAKFVQYLKQTKTKIHGDNAKRGDLPVFITTGGKIGRSHLSSVQWLVEKIFGNFFDWYPHIYVILGNAVKVYCYKYITLATCK